MAIIVFRSTCGHDMCFEIKDKEEDKLYVIEPHKELLCPDCTPKDPRASNLL